MREFQDNPTISMYQVRYKSLILYNYQLERRGTMNMELLRKFRENKTYSGAVTEGSQKRIRKAVDKLLQVSEVQKVYNCHINAIQKFRLNFVTLTVANNEQLFTASQMYDLCFKPFLRWMREVKKTPFYIWKAELQKRGQIHYHIVSNRYIDCMEIRAKWNELQKKAGIIDKFFETYGHYDPNGTDIHAVYKVKDLSAYFSKYLAKINKDDDGNTLDVTTGKIWDCSRALKQIKHFTGVCDQEFDFVDCKAIAETGDFEVKYLEKCTIIKAKKKSILTILAPEYRSKYLQWRTDNKRRPFVKKERPAPVVPVVVRCRPPAPVSFRPVINTYKSRPRVYKQVPLII